MIAYVFFTIIVEWILRILLFAKRKVFGRGQITLWSYKKEELTE
jgi:Na+-transporting NADH:ubiquinone oxidoreductase subunit NqrF